MVFCLILQSAALVLNPTSTARASPAQATRTKLRSGTRRVWISPQEPASRETWCWTGETRASVSTRHAASCGCHLCARTKKEGSRKCLCIVSECNAGYGWNQDTNTCDACSDNTYKSDMGNTACLELPHGTVVPEDLVVNGGNTGYGDY